MHIQFYGIWALLFLTCLEAAGQDEQRRLRYVAIETGIDFMAVKKAEKDYIRADMSDAYDLNHYYNRNLQNNVYKASVAVKAEVRTRNNFVGFITGLRFTHVTDIIERTGYVDYFYLRLRQTGTTTEYLKVEKLSQHSSFLSIPVEIRVFAYRERLFRLYFGAGGEAGYQLSTKNDITFDNPSMNSYGDEVSDIIGHPEEWYTAFYGKAGFMIGRDHPFLALGVTAPVIMGSRNAALSKTTAGFGIHIQAQIPF